MSSGVESVDTDEDDDESEDIDGGEEKRIVMSRRRSTSVGRFDEVTTVGSASIHAERIAEKADGRIAERTLSMDEEVKTDDNEEDDVDFEVLLSPPV